MSSPSRSLRPPPSPPTPSRSSQSTRSERLSHASNLVIISFVPICDCVLRLNSQVMKFLNLRISKMLPHLLKQSLTVVLQKCHTDIQSKQGSPPNLTDYLEPLRKMFNNLRRGVCVCVCVCVRVCVSLESRYYTFCMKNH